MSARRIAAVGLAVVVLAIVCATASRDRVNVEPTQRSVSEESDSASRPLVRKTERNIESVVTDASTPRNLRVKENASDRIDRGARRAAIDSIMSLADVPGLHAEAILADAALGHAEPAVREESIQALGERAGAIAFQALQHALQDSNRRVRTAAVRALINSGGDQAVWILDSALVSDRDVSMRINVIDALGEIGGSEAIRCLEPMMLDDNEMVREAAAEWLAELRRN